MRLSINLRGDLAKLSDAALVERIEDAWRDYAAAEQKPRRGELAGSWNGPIRHPLAYRLTSMIDYRPSRLSGHIGPMAQFTLGSLLGFPSIPEIDMHLTLCEIRDLMDEMERRVVRRTEVHA